MKKCPLRAYSLPGGERLGDCVENGCAWYIADVGCAVAAIGSVILNGFSLERMSEHGDYQVAPLSPTDAATDAVIEDGKGDGS